MNEELQKALATILNTATKSVEAGIDFLSAQLPEVIQQLLIFNAVKSALFFILWLSICVFLIVKSRQAWAKHKEQKSRYSDEMNDIWSAVFMLCAAFNAGFAMLNMDWLQIWLAPKLYLIEYAAHLAK